MIDPFLSLKQVEFVTSVTQSTLQPYSNANIELHEFSHPVVLFFIVQVTVTSVFIIAEFVNARIKGAVPIMVGVAPDEYS